MMPTNLLGVNIVRVGEFKFRKVTDKKIHRGLSHKTAERLYEMISIMPVWSPTIKNGEPVKYPFSMSFPFRYNDNRKYTKSKENILIDVFIRGSELERLGY